MAGAPPRWFGNFKIRLTNTRLRLRSRLSLMPHNLRTAIDRPHLVAVFAGGVAGTLIRAGLAEAWAASPSGWPWPTFAANIAGCVVLSWVISHLRVNGGSSRRLALLGTGLCGALTTFSTMQIEIYDLVDAGHAPMAAGYLVASLAIGLAAVSFTKRAVLRGRGQELA